MGTTTTRFCSCCSFYDVPDTIHDDIIRNIEARHRNPSSKSIESSPSSNTPYKKKSTVADRLSIFETKTKNTTKTTSKTTQKPKKKWSVKGIDDKKQNVKKPINTSSNKQSVVYETEPSVSLSHNDRMQLYEKDIVNVQQKEKDRIQQHKEQRGGYSGIKVSSEQKEMAKALLSQRVDAQKKGDFNNITLNSDVVGDIALKSNKTDSIETKKKKRTMTELLKDATMVDATNVIAGMGLIEKQYDNKEKMDMCILNMNNNKIMTRLTDEQKIKLICLIGHSIVDMSTTDRIERVTMCNAGVEDKLMIEFMKVLVENKECCVLKELWLESNRIGDSGMNALCTLIECNLESLTVIKLYNNKKDVSTGCCNKMMDALEGNKKIVKFTFEWRLQQQKDRMERVLKKNQELRRKSRINK